MTLLLSLTHDNKRLCITLSALRGSAKYREIFLIWARVFLNILTYFLEVMYYSLVARWTDRKHVTYNQS